VPPGETLPQSSFTLLDASGLRRGRRVPGEIRNVEHVTISPADGGSAFADNDPMLL
jgi:hypothetical protein